MSLLVPLPLAVQGELSGLSLEGNTGVMKCPCVLCRELPCRPPVPPKCLYLSPINHFTYRGVDALLTPCWCLGEQLSALFEFSSTLEGLNSAHWHCFLGRACSQEITEVTRPPNKLIFILLCYIWALDEEHGGAVSALDSPGVQVVRFHGCNGTASVSDPDAFCQVPPSPFCLASPHLLSPSVLFSYFHF